MERKSQSCHTHGILPVLDGSTRTTTKELPLGFFSLSVKPLHRPPQILSRLGLTLLLLLRVLGGYLELDPRSTLALIRPGWLPLAVALPLAAAASTLITPSGGWLVLVGTSAAAGLCMLAIVLLTSPLARHVIRDPLRYVRSG